MNDVDSGSVVFFCGAGCLALVTARGFPTLAELVDHVYEANRMEPR